MNKFITSTSLLSICLLTSCATIKGFRQPTDTWGQKGKKEQTKKAAKTVELPKQRTITPVRPIEGIPTSSGNNINKVVNNNAKNGRTVTGMIEPKNVTKLPDNKELQESNNIAPAPLPVTPKLETPVAPLLPVAPSLPDPSEPLPAIE